jgi:hypothetical protein
MIPGGKRLLKKISKQPAAVSIPLSRIRTWVVSATICQPTQRRNASCSKLLPHIRLMPSILVMSTISGHRRSHDPLRAHLVGSLERDSPEGNGAQQIFYLIGLQVAVATS